MGPQANPEMHNYPREQTIDEDDVAAPSGRTHTISDAEHKIWTTRPDINESVPSRHRTTSCSIYDRIINLRRRNSRELSPSRTLQLELPSAQPAAKGHAALFTHNTEHDTPSTVPAGMRVRRKTYAVGNTLPLIQLGPSFSVNLEAVAEGASFTAEDGSLHESTGNDSGHANSHKSAGHKARPARSQSHSAVSPSPSNQRRFTEYVSSDDPPSGARAASSEEGSAASPTMTHVLRRRATGLSQTVNGATEVVPAVPNEARGSATPMSNRMREMINRHAHDVHTPPRRLTRAALHGSPTFIPGLVSGRRRAFSAAISETGSIFSTPGNKYSHGGSDDSDSSAGPDTPGDSPYGPYRPVIRRFRSIADLSDYDSDSEDELVGQDDDTASEQEDFTYIEEGAEYGTALLSQPYDRLESDDDREEMDDFFLAPHGGLSASSRIHNRSSSVDSDNDPFSGQGDMHLADPPAPRPRAPPNTPVHGNRVQPRTRDLPLHHVLSQLESIVEEEDITDAADDASEPSTPGSRYTEAWQTPAMRTPEVTRAPNNTPVRPVAIQPLHFTPRRRLFAVNQRSIAEGDVTQVSIHVGLESDVFGDVVEQAFDALQTVPSFDDNEDQEGDLSIRTTNAEDGANDSFYPESINLDSASAESDSVSGDNDNASQFAPADESFVTRTSGTDFTDLSMATLAALDDETGTQMTELPGDETAGLDWDHVWLDDPDTAMVMEEESDDAQSDAEDTDNILAGLDGVHIGWHSEYQEADISLPDIHWLGAADDGAIDAAAHESQQSAPTGTSSDAAVVREMDVIADEEAEAEDGSDDNASEAETDSAMWGRDSNSSDDDHDGSGSGMIISGHPQADRDGASSEDATRGLNGLESAAQASSSVAQNPMTVSAEDQVVFDEIDALAAADFRIFDGEAAREETDESDDEHDQADEDQLRPATPVPRGPQRARSESGTSSTPALMPRTPSRPRIFHLYPPTIEVNGVPASSLSDDLNGILRSLDSNFNGPSGHRRTSPSTSQTDFIADELFDGTYEALLLLGERMGPAQLRIAPTREELRAGLIHTPPDEQEPYEKCLICMEEFEHQQSPVTSRHCKHPFHSECYLTWLERANTCPVCRKTVT